MICPLIPLQVLPFGPRVGVDKGNHFPTYATDVSPAVRPQLT